MIDEEQKNVIKSLEEQKKLLKSFKERLKQLRLIPQDTEDICCLEFNVVAYLENPRKGFTA